MGGQVDFDSFFRAEYHRLVAIGIAMVGDGDTAADLAQESMTRALGDWRHVGMLDSPAAWVHRVMVNLSIDRYRKRQREHVALSRLSSAPSSVAAEQSGECWSAVNELPDQQRQIVILRFVADQSMEQIAAALDISVGTVKSQLFRARHSLAKLLGAEEVVR